MRTSTFVALFWFGKKCQTRLPSDSNISVSIEICCWCGKFCSALKTEAIVDCRAYLDLLGCLRHSLPPNLGKEWYLMICMLHCRYHSENPMVRSAGILTWARVSEGSVLLLFYFLAYQKGILCNVIVLVGCKQLLLCNFFSSILVPLTGSEFRLRFLLGVLHKSPTWVFVFILQFVLEILLGGIELVNSVFQ